MDGDIERNAALIGVAVFWLLVFAFPFWLMFERKKFAKWSAESQAEEEGELGQAKPPATEAPIKKRWIRSFLLNHWKGNFSLAVSFWINFVLISLVWSAIVYAIDEISPIEEDADLPLYVLPLFVLYLGMIVAASIWQVVGIWRSASKHKRIYGKFFWASVTQLFFALVVSQGLLHNVNTLVGGAQFMFESVKVAAGIDKFSDYSIKVVRGDTLFINGYIAYGITEQIDGVFEQNPDLKTVSFYSLGGRVKPARHIRDLIEQKKLNTYSRSVCLSLCTYTFLAGQKRIVNVGTKIGFHGVAFPGLTDSDLKVQSKEFISYFRERGVPSEFAQKAFSTPPEDMWYPSYQELMEANFITHVRVYKKLIPVAKFCKKIDCSKSSDAPQWLQLEAAFNNLDLPQMIDGVTRLDSVVAGPGRNLTFQYVILDTEGAYSELIAQNLESFACKKETIQRYFEKEVNLHFLYLDKSGEQWFKKSIGSSTCESSLSTE